MALLAVPSLHLFTKQYHHLAHLLLLATAVDFFTSWPALSTTLYLHRLMTRSAWLGWKQTVTCLVAEKPVI